MAELLGVFSTMQLVVYLPLINIKFPKVALIFWGQIIEVIAFDLIPTDDLYPVWFGLVETNYIGCLEGNGAGKNCLQHFNDFDYGNTDFVMSMGSMFIVFNWIIFSFILYYVGK
jgi:hypothetical protein